MRSLRAVMAGIGTSSSMLAGAACLVILIGAVVAVKGSVKGIGEEVGSTPITAGSSANPARSARVAADAVSASARGRSARGRAARRSSPSSPSRPRSAGARSPRRADVRSAPGAVGGVQAVGTEQPPAASGSADAGGVPAASPQGFGRPLTTPSGLASVGVPSPPATVQGVVGFSQASGGLLAQGQALQPNFPGVSVGTGGRVIDVAPTAPALERRAAPGLR